MRIPRATLGRNWLVSTVAAALAFAVLTVSDGRLKALTGAGTADLQDFTTADQYMATFHAWGVHAYLARAGFDLGFDYLLMPLYAVALFYSGVLVMEAAAPAPGLRRRLLTLASLAPVAGAGLDAVENALQLHMLWNGPSDGLAAIAHTVSTAKWAAVAIGLFLLAGALFARVHTWQMRRLGRKNLVLDP